MDRIDMSELGRLMEEYDAEEDAAEAADREALLMMMEHFCPKRGLGRARVLTNHGFLTLTHIPTTSPQGVKRLQRAWRLGTAWGNRVSRKALMSMDIKARGPITTNAKEDTPCQA